MKEWVLDVCERDSNSPSPAQWQYQRANQKPDPRQLIELTMKASMKTYLPRPLLSKTLALVLLPALLLVGAAPPTRAGVVLRLAYGITGSPAIPGAYVTNLTSNALFPNSPDHADVLATNLMLSPFNVANDYGSLVRGFIEAPQTRPYTFSL